MLGKGSYRMAGFLYSFPKVYVSGSSTNRGTGSCTISYRRKIEAEKDLLQKVFSKQALLLYMFAELVGSRKLRQRQRWIHNHAPALALEEKSDFLSRIRMAFPIGNLLSKADLYLVCTGITSE